MNNKKNVAADEANYPSCFTLLFYVCALLLCATLYGCAPSNSSLQNSTTVTATPTHDADTLAVQDSFDALCENLFAETLRTDLLSLQYTVSAPEDFGIDHYTTSFGEYSLAAMENQLRALNELQSQLLSIDVTALRPDQQYTYDIMQYSIAQQLAGEPFFLFDEMLTASGGFHTQLPILLAEFPIDAKQDVNYYLALITDIPRYFQQLLDFQSLKHNAGLFMSDYSARQVIAQCEDIVTNGANSTAFSNGTHFLQSAFQARLNGLNLSAEEQASYIQKHNQLLCECFFPSYKQLSDGIRGFMNNASSSTATPSPSNQPNHNPKGLCSYPNGRAYYSYLTAQNIGIDSNIDILNKRVLDALDNYHQALSDLLKTSPQLTELLLSTTPEEQFAALPTNPEEILSKLSAVIANDFPVIDDLQYEVHSVDTSLESYLSPAFYLTPTIDGTATHSIYVNQSSTFTPLSFVTTLAHEGFPGHMYQNVYTIDQHFPPIRTLFCPLGYSEGWATYAEFCSYDYITQLCEDQISKELLEYYRLNALMNLAIYSTLDIGIHYYYWDEADAYDFLCEYGYLEKTAADSIYAYIVETPANYTSYFVGYLEFVDLRDDYKDLCEEQGRPFQLKTFHETILQLGEGPFPVLRQFLLGNLP